MCRSSALSCQRSPHLRTLSRGDPGCSRLPRTRQSFHLKTIWLDSRWQVAHLVSLVNHWRQQQLSAVLLNVQRDYQTRAHHSHPILVQNMHKIAVESAHTAIGCSQGSDTDNSLRARLLLVLGVPEPVAPPRERFPAISAAVPSSAVLVRPCVVSHFPHPCF